MPVAPRFWKSTFTPHTSSTQTQDNVQIVQLGNGDFWVSWRDTNNSGAGAPDGSDILGQRYSSIGEPIGENIRLNFAFNSDNERALKMAALPGSTVFAAVYEDFDDPGLYADIYLEFKDVAGVSSGAFTIATDPTASNAGINFANPNIAIASVEQGLIVYERINGADSDIVGQFFNPTTRELIGGAFDMPVGQDSGRVPQIIALSNGNYAVAWTDRDGADSAVFCVVLNSTGAMVNPCIIGNISGPQTDPGLAALTGGGFVLSYTSNIDANGDDIRTVLLDGNGIATPGTIPVAGGSGAQNESRVAATNDGGFVVIWEDDTTGQILMRARDSSGASAGSTLVIAEAVSTTPLVVTSLADGRIAVGYSAAGDAHVAIVDPRAAVNAAGVYAPDTQQIGTPEADTFTAGSAVDFIFGGDGDDVITDGPGTNRLIAGGNGNDTILVTGNPTPLESADGGAGTDTLSFSGIVAELTVDLLAGTAVVGSAGMSATNFENFTASLGSRIVVRGTESANQLTTGGGDDTLDGRGGADRLTGNGGNDLYFVDQAADVVIEASNGGSDRVFAAASWTLAAGSHVERLTTVDNLATTAINLTGNSLVQQLFGNAGSNTLDGGGGGDVMAGLEGDDFYRIRNVADRVVEAAGGGSDRVFAAASFTLEAGSEVELFTMIDNLATTPINLTGNGLSQYIYGNAGSNTLDGGGGGDVMAGLGGDDFYFIRNAADRVVEAVGAGSDRIFAAASFSLEAGSELEIFTTADNLATTAINLVGNSFGQFLYGNAGANILDGAAGSDVMTGFGGADVFVFSTTPGASNIDRITDFVSGADRIALGSALFGLPAGALNAGAFVVGTQAQDGNDRIIYNSATGALLFDADGTGATAAVQFATLDAHPVIAATDFIVV